MSVRRFVGMLAVVATTTSCAQIPAIGFAWDEDERPPNAVEDGVACDPMAPDVLSGHEIPRGDLPGWRQKIGRAHV